MAIKNFHSLAQVEKASWDKKTKQDYDAASAIITQELTSRKILGEKLSNARKQRGVT